MITTPSTPSILLANSIPAGISSADPTRFPTAVATASARAVEGERITAASARPKLFECPTVPEDVQMPIGVRSGSISIPTRSDRGEAPA